MMDAKPAYVGRAALVAVASLLMAMMWMFLATAPAQAQSEPYSNQSPDVLPTRITDDDDNPPETREPDDGDVVEDVTVDQRAQSGVLPFTGGEIVLFVVIGAAAVTIGFVLVRRARTDS